MSLIVGVLVVANVLFIIGQGKSNAVRLFNTIDQHIDQVFIILNNTINSSTISHISGFNYVQLTAISKLYNLTNYSSNILCRMVTNWAKSHCCHPFL